jgi:pantetheine-phosphate adenylyltransferase
MKKFKNVAVGGTFDELHRGHKTLLMKAFEIGDNVLIGLSSDEFAKKMNKPHVVAPYEQRLKDLKNFLTERGWTKRATVVRLDNPYGPIAANGGVDALVVSRETEPTAKEINKKRKEKSRPLLQIVVIDMVPSENHAPISTTRIRCGEIDREGHVLKQKNA